MSESRSPRDRLRAFRAGRVSQLLDPTPADGLPPTAPPRLTLNGKPVATGAAFDAVIAQAHSVKVDEALNAIFAKPANRSTKQRQTYPVGSVPVSPHAAQMYQAALKAVTNPLVVASLPIAAGGFSETMAVRKDLNNVWRQLSDEATDLSHILQFPSPANVPAEVGATPTPNSVSLPNNSEHLSQFERSNIEISVGDSIDLNALFRRGNEVTQRKNDYIAEQFKARLDQCFDMHGIDAESEHTHGGSDPERKERYFQDPRIRNTRGSGSTDGAVRIRIGGNNYYIDFQTHDELVDGSPTLREANNLKKLLRLAAIANQVIRGEIPLDTPIRPSMGETLAIHTFGKGRAGTTWEKWKQRIDQELDELFEDCQPINRFKMQIPTDPIDPPATP